MWLTNLKYADDVPVVKFIFSIPRASCMNFDQIPK